MRYQIVISVIIFITSCSIQENIYEKKIKECINMKFNDNTYKLDNTLELDYYQIIDAMENYFLSKGLLKGLTKQDYLNLISNIFELNTIKQKELYLNLMEVANNNNYNGLYFSTEVLQNCPHFILNMKGQKSTSMERQFKKLDKLFAFDPYSQENIKQLVLVVDEEYFKRLTYKTPIITILYDYLGYITEGN